MALMFEKLCRYIIASMDNGTDPKVLHLPLIAGKFTDNLLSLFLVHILSVPAIIQHLSSIAPECLAVLQTHEVFKKSLNMLCLEQNTKIVFNSLEGNYALCLLANLIQLGNIDSEALTANVSSFNRVVGSLLSKCQSYVAQKKSNNTHWHPVFGWFSQTTDHRLHEAMPFVVKQLQLLWNPRTVKLLFNDILKHSSRASNGSPEKMAAMSSHSKDSSSGPKNIILRKLQRSSSKSSSSSQKGWSITAPEVKTTCGVCELYQTSLMTLTQLRMDILTGLSYQDVLLSNLWKFIWELGPHGPLKLYTELLLSNETQPVFSVLILFCDCASHLITVLDDLELYEQQRPFQVEDLVCMSKFLNAFIYRMIWDHNSKSKHGGLLNSTHNLLMLLYDRDCRRSFTSENHWLIKELKPSVFNSELEKAKKRAQVVLQKIPHVVPHRDRVILFRKQVANENAALSITESVSASPASTLITVHRARLLEDGYRQLALLPAQALKGVIRVRFVNEQGLDEAGIDQDGVFKEFLEETIKTVFNPSLNLFRMTCGEQRLYPSPTSYIQDNHLQLFEFVGRMLGKAVYEGIVVEVPFASFFLSQVLGQQHSALYSPIDELPSLDPELYKSLTFIKDTGDTLGSVLRGFFTIRKKDPVGRLPTSSTCFNLLKLPNYQKKSTLREKLRYSITSNTGFELS
uniref:HECT-type E3 ubiquitin transferase n=1 Tax=Saccoglossus kowalevskii TaxID=10224 RepID=A0ABM0MDI6_SACKO|nr:PREDICTED: ubiquitin-protein ligase E3B-like [Saccoglossus kowalevskii]